MLRLVQQPWDEKQDPLKVSKHLPTWSAVTLQWRSRQVPLSPGDHANIRGLKKKQASGAYHTGKNTWPVQHSFPTQPQPVMMKHKCLTEAVLLQRGTEGKAFNLSIQEKEAKGAW